MNWTDFIAEQWLLFSALIAMGVALIFVESKKGGKTISFHQLTRLINRDEAVLVDVRESKDFKAGHIAQAINIPHAKFANNWDQLEKHKSKTIVVVDKMGQHAGTCGKILTDKQFTVLRLQGGMMEWVQQNMPVVKA